MMGWSGGDEIVGPVIRYLRPYVWDGGIDTDVATGALEVLVRSCQGRDWDTESETLGEFRDEAWVVEAFRRCEVYLVCGEEVQGPNNRRGSRSWHQCTLPLGHTVTHRDEDTEYEWR
jgi:hypothetical protein